MKALNDPKFIDNSDKSKNLSRLLREVISNYKKLNPANPTLKGNSELYIKSAIMLFLYIFPFIILLIFSPSVSIAIPLLFVIAFGMVGSALNIMHDAAHGSFSSKKFINSLMSKTINLQGASLLNWLIQHNYFHHKFTNIKDLDGDIKPPAVLFRFSEHEKWRRNHHYQHKYATFFYGFLTIGKFFGEIGSLIAYSKKKLPGQYKFNLGWQLVKVGLLKTVYCFIAIVLPILITEYTWWQVIISFFAVHYFSGILISFVFQTAHVVEGAKLFPKIKEGENIPRYALVHQIMTTFDFITNKFFSWFVGGLDRQILHHLFPTICHVHYKKIYKPVKAAILEAGYEYNENASFLKACMSHLRKLKELGKKPDRSIMSDV